MSIPRFTDIELDNGIRPGQIYQQDVGGRVLIDTIKIDRFGYAQVKMVEVDDSGQKKEDSRPTTTPVKRIVETIDDGRMELDESP